MPQNAGDKKESASPVATTLVAILVTAAGVLSLQQLPFKTSRQLPEGESRVAAGRSAQSVPARLWEDPFGAVERSSPALLSPPAPAELKDLARAWCGPTGHGESNLLLAAWVLGGQLPEQVEQRRRTRYAVLSSLHRANFSPRDSQYLGFFVDPVNAESPLYVPFEEFQHSEPASVPADAPRVDRRLLLLWLDEFAFLNSPLAMLTKVLKPFADCLVADKEPPRIMILGPTGARTLMQLTRDLHTIQGDLLHHVAIYSPWVRVENPEIGQSFLPPTTDLMDLLRKELSLRGVHLTPWSWLFLRQPPATIVLISDWDTSYGRDMPKIFRESVGAGTSVACDSQSNASTPRILHYTYLGGLDGMTAPIAGSRARELPGPQAAAKTGKDTPTDVRQGGDVPRRSPDLIEQAEGGGQFDYLRRLARRIAQDVKAPGGACRNGWVEAVGILGSDVYDKLVVLQAVREEFPQALFFSIDLDARLLHPQERKRARNLIVASAFGLAVHPALQCDIPPFRDTYQTAAFYTTLAALHQRHPLGDCPHGALPRLNVTEELFHVLPAKIFEIGRTKAFDLPVASGRNETQGSGQVASEPFFPYDVFSTFVVVLSVLLGGSLLCASTLASRKGWTDRLAWYRTVCAHPPWSRKTRAFTAAMGLFGVAVAGLVTWAIFEYRSGTGEPFALFEGISMWPTEMVRLMALLFMAVCLIDMRFRLHRIDTEIAAYFPALTGSRANASTLARGGPLLLHKLELIDWSRNPRTFERLSAGWKAYQANTSLRVQGRRVAVSVVVFFLWGCLVLWGISGFPNMPYRGGAMWALDKTLLFAVIVSFLALTFCVRDSIRLCDIFTRELADDQHTTPWSDELERKAQVREQLGLGGRADVHSKEAVEETISNWLDLEVIGRWTAIVGPLVYFPFVVASLLAFARLKVFDHWEHSMGLYLVMATTLVIAAHAAWTLRKIAERSRNYALKCLDRRLTILAAYPDADRLVTQLRSVRQRVESLREGAFARISEQPVVRAILWPLGGAGGATLLNYLHLAG